MNPAPFSHQSVLAAEVLQAFAGLPSLAGQGLPQLVDCTLGGGGHSALLLSAHPTLEVIGLDQDPQARAAAAVCLAPWGERIQIVAGNFSAFTPDRPVQGVLADLGVSSPQLDGAVRGFSFQAEGPIDMRMNPEAGKSAAELLDQLEEGELADLLYDFGEERLSRRIARRLVAERVHRPWRERTTTELAYAIAGCYPPKARHGRLHPATRSFQALRIAVNDELGAWSARPIGWLQEVCWRSSASTLLRIGRSSRRFWMILAWSGSRASRSQLLPRRWQSIPAVVQQNCGWLGGCEFAQRRESGCACSSGSTGSPRTPSASRRARSSRG
jgi:16S rRNA (cytosine1402-N4)-methyltransferase